MKKTRANLTKRDNKCLCRMAVQFISVPPFFVFIIQILETHKVFRYLQRGESLA